MEKNNGREEKIYIHRGVWLLLILLSIIVPKIIVSSVKKSQPELKVVNCEISSNNYYSSLNESSVSVELTFNVNVYSGYATIKFYDEHHQLLSKKREYFYAFDGNIANCYLLDIEGEVKSCAVESFEFDSSKVANVSMRTEVIKYCILFVAVICFIGSLLLSYKEVNLNGKVISVYAGWYHHTLRVNKQKCDEHNTFISYTPIKLSTTLDDGIKIEATITLTNRISIKANDKLI